GDSNMSPFANALKIGTTAAVLSLLEQRQLPRNLVLNDAVRSTRDISRDATRKWIVDLENGKTIGALDVQWQFHDLAQRHLRRRILPGSTTTLCDQLGLDRARQPRLSRHGRPVRNLQRRGRQVPRETAASF